MKINKKFAKVLVDELLEESLKVAEERGRWTCEEEKEEFLQAASNAHEKELINEKKFLYLTKKATSI